MSESGNHEDENQTNLEEVGHIITPSVQPVPEEPKEAFCEPPSNLNPSSNMTMRERQQVLAKVTKMRSAQVKLFAKMKKIENLDLPQALTKLGQILRNTPDMFLPDFQGRDSALARLNELNLKQNELRSRKGWAGAAAKVDAISIQHRQNKVLRDMARGFLSIFTINVGYDGLPHNVVGAMNDVREIERQLSGLKKEAEELAQHIKDFKNLKIRAAVSLGEGSQATKAVHWFKHVLAKRPDRPHREASLLKSQTATNNPKCSTETTGASKRYVAMVGMFLVIIVILSCTYNFFSVHKPTAVKSGPIAALSGWFGKPRQTAGDVFALRKAWLNTVMEIVKASPSRNNIFVRGEVQYRKDNELSIYGFARYPSNGAAPDIGPPPGKEGNIVIINPDAVGYKPGSVYFTSGEVVFKSVTQGTNRMGGSVPVWVYEPAPPTTPELDSKLKALMDERIAATDKYNAARFDYGAQLIAGVPSAEIPKTEADAQKQALLVPAVLQTLVNQVKTAGLSMERSLPEPSPVTTQVDKKTIAKLPSKGIIGVIDQQNSLGQDPKNIVKQIEITFDPDICRKYGIGSDVDGLSAASPPEGLDQINWNNKMVRECMLKGKITSIFDDASLDVTDTVVQEAGLNLSDQLNEISFMSLNVPEPPTPKDIIVIPDIESQFLEVITKYARWDKDKVPLAGVATAGPLAGVVNKPVREVASQYSGSDLVSASNRAEILYQSRDIEIENKSKLVDHFDSMAGWIGRVTEIEWENPKNDYGSSSAYCYKHLKVELPLPNGSKADRVEIVFAEPNKPLCFDRRQQGNLASELIKIQKGDWVRFSAFPEERYNEERPRSLQLNSFSNFRGLGSIAKISLQTNEPRFVSQAEIPTWPARFLLAIVTDGKRSRVIQAQMLSKEIVRSDSEGEELKSIRGRLHDPLAEK